MKCTKCDIDKPLDDFYKRKSGRVERQCKKCMNAAGQQNYQKTKAVRKAKAHEYNITHKAEIALNKQQYYQENKGRIEAYKKQWAEKTFKANPYLVMAKRMRRLRYRDTAADLEYMTVELLESMLRRTKTCPYCKCVLKHTLNRAEGDSASLDKVIPERGYVKGNLDIICRQCNRKKQDATAAEHRAFADRMDTFKTT